MSDFPPDWHAIVRFVKQHSRMARQHFRDVADVSPENMERLYLDHVHASQLKWELIQSELTRLRERDALDDTSVDIYSRSDLQKIRSRLRQDPILWLQSVCSLSGYQMEQVIEATQQVYDNQVLNFRRAWRPYMVFREQQAIKQHSMQQQRQETSQKIESLSTRIPEDFLPSHDQDQEDAREIHVHMDGKVKRVRVRCGESTVAEVVDAMRLKFKLLSTDIKADMFLIGKGRLSSVWRLVDIRSGPLKLVLYSTSLSQDSDSI